MQIALHGYPTVKFYSYNNLRSYLEVCENLLSVEALSIETAAMSWNCLAPAVKFDIGYMNDIDYTIFILACLRFHAEAK